MRQDDINEVVEAVFLAEDGSVLGVQPEQRPISRANFLIREINRIGKKEAEDADARD